MDHPSQTLPALVLAAGLSSRMGAFKPLLELGGVPLVRHVIDALQASGCIGRIVVVSGHRRGELEAALPAGVERVFNPGYAQGEMLSSVKVGLRKLHEAGARASGGFLLAFADQPAVLSGTIAMLVARFIAETPQVAQPVYGRQKGHPLILSASLLGEIEALGAGDTLRTVTARHAHQTLLVPVDDPAVVEDLDTPEDYARATRRLAGAPAEKNPRAH